MSFRKTGKILILVAMALALAAAPALAAKPIKIAQLAGITGPYEAYAKQALNGFKMGLEYGTNHPTVFHPNLGAQMRTMQARNPDLRWPVLLGRAGYIFRELQEAWSTLQWERARPLETDSLFQMHRYWIERYQRQQMRNELRDVNVDRLDIVRAETDGYFETITIRIYARMIDVTLDQRGAVVGGNAHQPRVFSEYWTFIRRYGVRVDGVPDPKRCPSCGAGIRLNAAGICAHCNTKVTSGEFDWVLAMIEQDEAYAG